MHLSQADNGTAICHIYKAANCWSADKKKENRITYVA